MSLALLLDVAHSPIQGSWAERNKAAFEALFGNADGRYPKQAAKAVTLRAPGISSVAASHHTDFQSDRLGVSH